MLFILFINDISNITANGVFTKSYADDLKLYTSLTSLDDCHLQIVLSNLLIWSNDWQLKVNISKCHIFHLHKNNPLMEYYFNHIRLEPCYLINDLVLTLIPYFTLITSSFCSITDQAINMFVPLGQDRNRKTPIVG